jgi:hypothetical protein
LFILQNTWNSAHWAMPRTWNSIPRTQYSVFSIQYLLPGIQHLVICSFYEIPGTQYSLPRNSIVGIWYVAFVA